MAGKIEVDVKLFIGMIAFIILATVGSAFTTYLIFGTGRMNEEVLEVESAVEVKPEMGPTYDVGEFTVNLATNGLQSRFVRTGIVLEANERNVVSELERRHPQIRDRIIGLLRTRTPEQLNQKDGLDVLRYEIVESINELLIRGEVVDVFFVDLVIQ